MVGLALQLSEEYDTPVMLRITTRVAHSRTLVEKGSRSRGNPGPIAGTRKNT